MNNSILPLKRRGDKMNVRRENESPVMAIQEEMNRMFDQFFSDSFGLSPLLTARTTAEFLPRIDISETDTAMKVTAELPGMDEKDIQINLERDALILTGEKKAESEEKSKSFHRVERSYGSFQRVIPLVSDVEENKIEAVFKNGVLTITLPKPAASVKAARKIAIKTS
jgi:HSP20 family protein